MLGQQGFEVQTQSLSFFYCASNDSDGDLVL